MVKHSSFDVTRVIAALAQIDILLIPVLEQKNDFWKHSIRIRSLSHVDTCFYRIFYEGNIIMSSDFPRQCAHFVTPEEEIVKMFVFMDTYIEITEKENPYNLRMDTRVGLWHFTENGFQRCSAPFLQ